MEPALKTPVADTKYLTEEMIGSTLKTPVADTKYLSEEMIGSTDFRFISKLLDKAEGG